MLGRGPALAIAAEAALKTKETAARHAEAFSLAEVMHGPLQLVGPGFPVLAFVPDDAAGAANRAALGRLAATGAKVWSFHASQDPSHVPDVGLRDGDTVAGWTAIHTPGHAGDHLCFARADGVVFTADHIMSWSTSVVSPPHGNMADYFASMRRMLAREDRVYLPGHGPKLDDPIPFARALLSHRAQRETAIANALAAGPKTTMGLVDALYVGIDARLKPAAQRTVIAHLEKLRDEGRAAADGEIWRAA
jgi:glyoxylase-like metal-dependent hydrolase (beta-lactamase superfamily II)